METSKRKSTAPFYAAAVVWLAYALILPLYEPIHYILAAGASLLAFLAASVLSRSGAVGETVERSEAAEKPAAEPTERKQASTGNPELDKMIRDGDLAIR